MNTVERIQQEIESLPPEEYAQLRKWFADRDWKNWDTRLESDSEAGKLDFLIEEAMKEKKAKKLGEI